MKHSHFILQKLKGHGPPLIASSKDKILADMRRATKQCNILTYPPQILFGPWLPLRELGVAQWLKETVALSLKLMCSTFILLFTSIATESMKLFVTL